MSKSKKQNRKAINGRKLKESETEEFKKDEINNDDK
jgi:hypothetical protein